MVRSRSSASRRTAAAKALALSALGLAGCRLKAVTLGLAGVTALNLQPANLQKNFQTQSQPTRGHVNLDAHDAESELSEGSASTAGSSPPCACDTGFADLPSEQAGSGKQAWAYRGFETALREVGL